MNADEPRYGLLCSIPLAPAGEPAVADPNAATRGFPTTIA